MPALVVFGRRSRIGSDDLYCPAMFLLMFQLPLLLLALGYVLFGRGCSSLAFHDDGFPFWFVLASLPINGFMASVYLMIMHVSAKGTIIEHERRMLIPRLLHVHLLWSIAMLGYSAVGLYFWYNRPICVPDSRFVLVRPPTLFISMLAS